ASKRAPANSYEAQFSIPYLVGTALAKGRLGLDDIEAQALRDETVLALAARTDYALDPDSGFPKYYAGEVVVELNDGRVVREREAVNRGSIDRPLTKRDIVEKFRSNAGRQLGDSRTEHIAQGMLNMDSQPAKEIEQLLGQSLQLETTV